MKILVKRADGGVSVIVPTAESTPELRLRDALAVAGYVSHREIADEDIPATREFRNAWTDDYPGQFVDVDPAKAVDVALAELRQDRQQKFNELGFPVKLNPAVEEAIVPAETRAQLQELRDITNELKTMSTTIVSGPATEEFLAAVKSEKDQLKG